MLPSYSRRELTKFQALGRVKLVNMPLNVNGKDGLGHEASF